MFGILRERPAMKAAIAAIAPLVDRTRASMGGLPTAAWLDPYLVGLIGMLITIIVRRVSPDLGESSLASVQSRAWAALTGLDACLFGPEVAALSARRDPAFLAGCANADRIAALLKEAVVELERPIDGSLPHFDHDACGVLWARYFDGYLDGRPDVSRL